MCVTALGMLNIKPEDASRAGSTRRKMFDAEGATVGAALEGTHRVEYPHRIWWLIFGVPVVFWGSVPLYDSWSSRGAFLALGLAALLRALAAVVWRPQTVVTPQGLSVREGWRPRNVPWAELESVHTSGRWHLRREVTVLPQNGPWIALPGIPESRVEEVRMYWKAHAENMSA